MFISGEPGSSKSLSVELLYKAMKGEISEDEFFKKLPRLFMCSYQISLASTSQSVLKYLIMQDTLLKTTKKMKILFLWFILMKWV